MRAAAGLGRGSPVVRAGTQAALRGGLLLGLLACGWAVAGGHAKVLLIAPLAAGVALVALKQRGAFIGLIVLAAMNGIPFFDTSPYVASRLNIADVAVFVLLAAALAWIFTEREQYRPTRAGQMISCAGVALLLWWGWTVVRTLSDGYGPFTRAASFGRDFAFFALLLIVLPYVRLSSRQIAVMLGVLTVGVCVFAIGQIMIAIGLGSPGSLVHFQFTLSESGLTRVYANMTDLVTAGAAVSIMAALLAPQRRLRLTAIPVALLLSTSTVVQLTRARWIGLVIGLLFVAVWLVLRGEEPLARLLRRRLGLTLGVLGVVLAVVLLLTPGIFSGGTVVHRLLSVFSTIQSGSGTIHIREVASKSMTTYLGGSWLGGLGFISPSAHYFFGLPLGSIRDTDLGVLNAVMTMGVIGAVLIYLPVVIMLVFCLRSSAGVEAPPYGWLRYGGAVWIVGTLASSVTLVTLFSAGGLVLSAVFLTLLASPDVLPARRTAAAAVLARRAYAPVGAGHV